MSDGRDVMAGFNKGTTPDSALAWCISHEAKWLPKLARAEASGWYDDREVTREWLDREWREMMELRNTIRRLRTLVTEAPV